jgi:hypothetical protein
MADLAAQLLEDRALRNAARGQVKADVAFIRESVKARSLPARLADRVTGGARDIADEAVAVADENRAAVQAWARQNGNRNKPAAVEPAY